MCSKTAVPNAAAADLCEAGACSPKDSSRRQNTTSIPAVRARLRCYSTMGLNSSGTVAAKSIFGRLPQTICPQKNHNENNKNEFSASRFFCRFLIFTMGRQGSRRSIKTEGGGFNIYATPRMTTIL